jgi:hypothetical protein
MSLLQLSLLTVGLADRRPDRVVMMLRYGYD